MPLAGFKLRWVEKVFLKKGFLSFFKGPFFKGFLSFFKTGFFERDSYLFLNTFF